MYDETIELLSKLADTENFIVHIKESDKYAVDVNEVREPIAPDIFDHALGNKLIKKLADLEDEDFYVISDRGKEYLAAAR